MSAPTDLVVESLRGPMVGPVSLTVPAGTCAVIMGPSGAGKSLLLRMIADLDPGDGEVCLGDVRRAAIPAPDWRRRVAYVAAEAGWWAPCVGAHFPPEAIETSAADAARLGLRADWRDRPIATLSTGERQRLALLRALAREPTVLLLDEPTSGLDAESVTRAEALLHAQLTAGRALIVISHDAAQADRLASRRYAMACGRLQPA